MKTFRKNESLLVKILLAAWMLAPVSVCIAEEISWVGCGITKHAFMDEIANAYQAKTGDVIKVSGGGATMGIRSVSAGSSDMGGTCRHFLYDSEMNIHPEEKNAELIRVAWDAIAVIVHPDNPVSNITLQQLKDIYDGRITDWNALGGPDRRIILCTRDGKDSGAGNMFRYLVFGDPDYEFKARSLTFKSSGPLEKKIEKTEAAMGISGISSARKRDVKFLSLDGISPDKVNIAAADYPLWRPLYIAVNRNPSPKVRNVIDFILGDEGQAIISRQGTVNLAEGEILKTLWEKRKEKIGMKSE